jgi:5-methylcytosine-specific restriction enzyme subunit McrC
VETELELSLSEQADLEELGRHFAQKTGRFGEAVQDSKSTLIRCVRTSPSKCKVTVVDAVGVVGTPQLQITVIPKIPVAHLVYLFQAADLLPRLADTEANLAKDASLLELVAHWYMVALEGVLRSGLARDYQSTSADLAAVRGRVLPLRTSRLYYAGRVAVAVEYDDFTFDTPLNRSLRFAARIVASTPLLPWALRRRAMAATSRMEEAGELRADDLLTAYTERRTAHYNDALLLARHLIAGTGRTLAAGPRKSWAFLIKTATPVEEGIRAVLAERLAGSVQVTKHRRQLHGSHMSITPDIVLSDDLAVADVKYKLVRHEWDRPDLYQVVAFAAGFKTGHASLIAFRKPSQLALPPVHVGDIRVAQLSWPATPGLEPSEAAEDLGAQALDWVLTAMRAGVAR